MSSSSLWVMNNNFYGEEVTKFGNSWLFTPVAWNILLDKYIPKKPYEGKRSFISASMLDNSLFGKLNEKINNTPVQEDRVLWELGNQQVFFTKDKDFIADCITAFLTTNSDLAIGLGGHIYTRYAEVASEIRSINETEYPYFVFKNTSCDDGVEHWFTKYNDETGEYEPRSLREMADKPVTEFVVIDERKIINFIGNVDYFNGMKTGDKVKSLIDGKIYTVEKADNLNKILRLEELSGTWNYKDFEKV